MKTEDTVSKIEARKLEGDRALIARKISKYVLNINNEDVHIIKIV